MKNAVASGFLGYAIVADDDEQVLVAAHRVE
jgi:hypothetical protein